jgi:hypothetical protein
MYKKFDYDLQLKLSPGEFVDKKYDLTFIGDLILADHPLYYGIGVSSKWENKKVDYFHYVRRYLSNSSVVVGNLETPITKKLKRSYYASQLLSNVNILSSLPSSINILSIANNHILQHGESVFFETIDALSAANIAIIGQYGQGILLKNIDNYKVGFISFSMRPEQFCAENTLYEHRIDFVEEQLKRERKNYDKLIVYVHWGDEYAKFASQEQKDAAMRLVAAGADFVVGHHTHVIQDNIILGNSKVFYGLGNFVSDMCQDEAKLGIMISVKFINNQDKVDVFKYIINSEYQPKIIGEESLQDYSLNSANDIITNNYMIEVLASQKRFRKEYQLFLLRNFFKYPLHCLVHILNDYFRRLYYRVNKR